MEAGLTEIAISEPDSQESYRISWCPSTLICKTGMVMLLLKGHREDSGKVFIVMLGIQQRDEFIPPFPGHGRRLVPKALASSPGKALASQGLSKLRTEPRGPGISAAQPRRARRARPARGRGLAGGRRLTTG